MPRRARLCIPGIPWHIIQRGINRTYQCSGTLWEGRFRSCLTETKTTCWLVTIILSSMAHPNHLLQIVN